MRDRNLLTRAEFHVMHHLWSLPEQCGYAGDILKNYEEPQPAYTTIAPFLKILETKGFIKSHKKGHKVIFRPAITRQEYAAIALGEAKDYYFDGSFTDMMRFFLSREHLTQDEVDKLIQLIHETQDV